MILNEVSGINLNRLNREANTPNREFSKKILARAKTENPLYAVLVQVLADSARAQRAAEGPNSPQDVHDLVIDTGMLCLRALELAALDGKRKTDSDMLMEDPAMDTLAIPLLEAIIETRLVLSAIRGKLRK